MEYVIDHLVLNVGISVQTDKAEIERIRAAGFPYEPSWGKGTRGFKASNLWIGKAYFEMIRLLKPDGGGWKADWVDRYNQGHRGLICLMLDVPDIARVGAILPVSKPEPLRFKWFFGLLTRTMPWQNAYLDFFEGAPFQLGFQQMDDEKARSFMTQYMVPNSSENGIQGIGEMTVTAPFTDRDMALIEKVFGARQATLGNGEKLSFVQGPDFAVQIIVRSDSGRYAGESLTIENVRIEVTT